MPNRRPGSRPRSVRRVDTRPFEDAGFYDPEAADAGDKLELLEYLVDIGVDEDTILRGVREDHVHAAGLSTLLDLGELSAAELAGLIGTEPDTIVDVYRLLGVDLEGIHARVLLDEEAEAVGMLVAAGGTLQDDEVPEILRAAAHSLATVAEAIVSVFVGGVESRIVRKDLEVSHVERARLTQSAGQDALAFGRFMGLLFRHHLRQAIDRQRASMSSSTGRSTRRMTIGFVDLVGFTPISAGMSPDELVEFVRGFEARSYDIASRAGGRIVKTIGDEVMVSALSPDAGASIVLELIGSFDDSGTTPRGGLATGEVVARHGDFFGPVVNLASRLVDHAVPGEVLADEATAAGLGEGFSSEAAGRRMLKGFEEPMTVASVRRSAAGAGA
jgi:adenylate cyclase